MATFDFVICESFETMSRFSAGSVSLRAMATSDSALLWTNSALITVALDVGFLFLRVDADQRVAGLGAAHRAEVLHGAAAQLGVLLGVGDLDQARGIAADEQRLQDLALHFRVVSF